jgi:hypothetical protein
MLKDQKTQNSRKILPYHSNIKLECKILKICIIVNCIQMFWLVTTFLKSQRDITFNDCKSLCYLILYKTHLMTCDCTIVISQFLIGYTAMKQNMSWTDGTHTSSYDNSNTFFRDSKLKIKKQGSFFITLIDRIFKRHLIVISHQTPNLSKDHKLNSTVCINNPEQKKREREAN